MFLHRIFPVLIIIFVLGAPKKGPYVYSNTIGMSDNIMGNKIIQFHIHIVPSNVGCNDWNKKIIGFSIY